MCLTAAGQGIPLTYVPARNTIMLSLALAWAEVLGSTDIFVGVNRRYSGYPDCRQEFIAAFERLANLATKAGVEGKQTTIHAPLIDDIGKAEISQQAMLSEWTTRSRFPAIKPTNRAMPAVVVTPVVLGETAFWAQL